jgi:hypothetical protein
VSLQEKPQSGDDDDRQGDLRRAVKEHDGSPFELGQGFIDIRSKLETVAGASARKDDTVDFARATDEEAFIAGHRGPIGGATTRVKRSVAPWNCPTLKLEP